MPHAGQTGTVNEISKKVRQCLGSSAWVASCLPPADAVKRKEEAGGEGGLFLSPSPAGSDFLSAGITSGPQVRRDPAATGWPDESSDGRERIFFLHVIKERRGVRRCG